MQSLTYNILFFCSVITLFSAPPTLVSMYDTSILESNLDAVLRPLTEQDEQVVDHLEKAFFAPLPQRHWEGVELKPIGTQ